jgi:hypothetical protein
VAAALSAGCTAVAGDGRIAVQEARTTAIPSGTADPRALAAVSTYREFVKTVLNAERKPLLKSKDYPEDADFTRYAIDPVQAQYEGFIMNLARSGHAFRGTPPTSTIGVKSIDLDAKPYPLVTLTDCQSKRENWRAYHYRTDVMNPKMTPGPVAPYGYTIDVVMMQHRWMVQAIRPDPAGTCPG